MQAISIHSVDTEYSADCIEFCSHEGYQDIFICGTYQVLEPSTSLSDIPAQATSEAEKDGDGDNDDDDNEAETKTGDVKKVTERAGRLLLFRLIDGGKKCIELQRIECPAILDAKWSPELHDGQPELAVANAKGGIIVYRLCPDKTLEEIENVQVTDPTTLCLSLDYSPFTSGTHRRSIMASLSSGHLSLISQTEAGYEVSSSWKAHDYEPWITVFDKQDPNKVWSGGDDLILKSWDLRMTEMPIARYKSFEGGVTTIAPSPYTEHLLAVGSYDENLRLFDTRNIKEPLRVVPCGGGIWRTKFHPSSSRKGDVLLACMHGGFNVLNLDETLVGANDIGNGQTERLDWKVTGDEEGCHIVTRFEEHKSLAYGADWCRLPAKDDGTSLVASCSFYDHTMHLWRA